MNERTRQTNQHSTGHAFSGPKKWTIIYIYFGIEKGPPFKMSKKHALLQICPNNELSGSEKKRLISFSTKIAYFMI